MSRGYQPQIDNSWKTVLALFFCLLVSAALISSCAGVGNDAKHKQQSENR